MDAGENLVREAHRLTLHLAAPRPLRYWSELLASVAIGWTALYVCGTNELPWAVAWFVVSVLAFYRAAVFIHEVVHLKGRAMQSYQVGWNTLVGVPLLMPSFFYEIHLTHHARSHYGTTDDAEYIPWGGRQRDHVTLLPLISVVSPLMGIARFLLLTPLGWLIPRFRPWLYESASAIKNRVGHRRSDLIAEGLPWWRIQEAAACLWIWSVAAMVYVGWFSRGWVWLVIAVMSAVALVNSFRILASHRYGNEAHRMSLIEQITDSVNHPGGLLTELWAPAGLRYHALHHLLPALPYHALGEAHRILMRELPEGSYYRQTNSPSLWHSLKTLWADARKGRESPLSAPSQASSRP